MVNSNYFNGLWWNCGRKWFSCFLWVFLFVWSFVYTTKMQQWWCMVSHRPNDNVARLSHISSVFQTSADVAASYHVHFCRLPMLIVHFNQLFVRTVDVIYNFNCDWLHHIFDDPFFAHWFNKWVISINKTTGATINNREGEEKNSNEIKIIEQDELFSIDSHDLVASEKMSAIRSMCWHK